MNPKVCIIGGGPGGLYLARLLKLASPAMNVVVQERMDGNAPTFGFGIGLTESTMQNLEDADPETAERIREASYVGHELRLRGTDGDVALHGARNLAIGRARLLEVLAEAADAAGVQVIRGSTADSIRLDADIVVAADGVGSATRERYASELGARSSLGRTRFVWCGADFAVDSAFFSAVAREESLFVAHAYPYATNRSTFLIEVDDQTWQHSNLETFDRQAPRGETDHASVELLESVFATDLRGRPLLTNRTRWSRFADLTLDRWSAGNVVLLGDAAHTAHYTLGSGTKLALEDAIALAQAITGEASIQSAFAAYESARRPPVERFKKLARRSQAWWDSYRFRHGRPAARLALSFMTRSGNIMLRDFAAEQHHTIREALTWLGEVPADMGRLDGWVLSRPLVEDQLELPGRLVEQRALDTAKPVRELAWNDPDAWGQAADALLAQVRRLGTLPVLMTGPPSPEAVAARIDMAERIRLQTDAVVGLHLPAVHSSLAATTVAAERADFVVTP